MTPTHAIPSPDGRRRGFLSRHEEGDVATVPLRGQLPGWLRGTCLLNGPALWDLPQGRFLHWFDGLAQLHALQIPGTGQPLSYRSRFLRSEAYERSLAAGKPVLGGYGTRDGRGLLSRLLSIANPPRTDNAAVVMSRIGKRCIATTESDRAHWFDPYTLDSLGELRWRDEQKLPLMAAHPRVDAQGRWWNVGIALGRTCEYRLFHATDDGQRHVKASIPVKRAGYLHAFALTATHAVLWEAALRAQPLRFLFSGEPYIEHFDWLPAGGSRLHAVSLADGRVRSWDAPPLLAFHAPQAFDAGHDIVLDLCTVDPGVNEQLMIDRLRANPLGRDWLPRHLRFVLAAGAGSARIETLPGRFDLPQVHHGMALQGPVRHVFGAGVDEATPGEFFNQVLKLDLASGEIRRWQREHALSLEPLFVPRPGGSTDDDGVLLVHTLADEDPGSVIVALDAATLQEQARIELPHVVPFGFHGAWLPASA
ncbi:MAG: carotenoid oxygenase family protein [Pseudomonadota bacterium]